MQTLMKQGGKNNTNPLAVSSTSCTNASKMAAKKRKFRPERSMNLLKKQHNLHQTGQFSWTQSAANNSATFVSLTGGNENEEKGGGGTENNGGGVDLQHPPPTSEKQTTVNCSPKTFIDTVSTGNRLHTSGFHLRKMEQLD